MLIMPHQNSLMYDLQSKYHQNDDRIAEPSRSRRLHCQYMFSTKYIHTNIRFRNFTLGWKIKNSKVTKEHAFGTDTLNLCNDWMNLIFDLHHAWAAYANSDIFMLNTALKLWARLLASLSLVCSSLSIKKKWKM